MYVFIYHTTHLVKHRIARGLNPIITQVNKPGFSSFYNCCFNLTRFEGDAFSYSSFKIHYCSIFNLLVVVIYVYFSIIFCSHANSIPL